MSNPKYDLVAFDCDGTLTDTGITHIRWCNDINRERGYALPEIDERDKEAVKRVLGTPMSTIIRKYGFPVGDIGELVQTYERTFSRDDRYISRLFPGVISLLLDLRKARINTGIVTSNVMENVARDLGPNLADFTETVDKQMLEKMNWRKSGALKWMKESFESNSPVYIGDTSGDREAAEEAGWPFIWVVYGWGTPPQDYQNKAQTVPELAEKLFGQI